jgi:Fe-S-cluster containining protein
MSITYQCIRCGTCCRKGGPAFHLEDKPLIEKCVIPSHHLYTIRQGELAHDHITGKLIPIETDIIKIKDAGNASKHRWSCCYFDPQKGGCSIYPNRPLECRVLKCWDTRALIAVYDKNRLTRKDLFYNVKGLWELIEDHQSKCSLSKIRTLLQVTGTKKIKAAAKNELYRIIDYDQRLRRLVTKKLGTSSRMLDFLFGRALIHILPTHTNVWKPI